MVLRPGSSTALSFPDVAGAAGAAASDVFRDGVPGVDVWPDELSSDTRRLGESDTRRLGESDTRRLGVSLPGVCASRDGDGDRDDSISAWHKEFCVNCQVQDFKSYSRTGSCMHC